MRGKHASIPVSECRKTIWALETCITEYRQNSQCCSHLTCVPPQQWMVLQEAAEQARALLRFVLRRPPSPEVC